MRSLIGVILGLVGWVQDANAKRELVPLSAQMQQEILQHYHILLKRGSLVLIERQNHHALKQITIMRWIQAPLKRVYALISQFENYPKILPNVRTTQIIKREGNTFWASMKTGVAMISMQWVTRVHLVSSEQIEMQVVSGDVRDGGWSWRLVAVGPNKQHTAIFGTYYSEVQQASWILRWMLKQIPGMDIAINLGAGISFVEAVQRAAEKRVIGTQRLSVSQRRPQIQPIFSNGLKFEKLIPLLKRGDLALIESFADGSFRQGNLMARFRISRQRTYDVVRRVRQWKQWIPNLQKVEIDNQNAQRIAYRLKVKLLPFYALRTRHRMYLFRNLLRVHVVGGSIKWGRYQYEFHDIPKGSAFVSSFCVDLRSSSAFLRNIFENNKEVEHGMALSSAVIWLDSLRKYLEKP